MRRQSREILCECVLKLTVVTPATLLLCKARPLLPEVRHGGMVDVRVRIVLGLRHGIELYYGNRLPLKTSTRTASRQVRYRLFNMTRGEARRDMTFSLA